MLTHFNIFARQLNQVNTWRIFTVSMGSSSAVPPPSKIQLPKPNERGYLRYERFWSRDPRFKPQVPGDTIRRLLFRRLGHAYEIYPLIFLVGLWFCWFLYIAYISFSKLEVWIDRRSEMPPWHWSRIRDNYWKKHTVIYDPNGVSHTRLEIMEKLQDQMAEAARARAESG